MSANLGRSISKHRGTVAAGGWFWYVGGVLVLAGVVGLARLGSPPPGQTAAEVGTTGLAGLVAGALCLLMPISRWRQCVEVFERGFVWTHLFGARTVTRTDIAGVELLTKHTRMGSVTKVIATLRSGQRITLAGLEDPAQLSNFLRAAPAPNVQAWVPPGAAPAPAWGPPGAAPGGWRPPGT
jgi:hypothetical protein